MEGSAHIGVSCLGASPSLQTLADWEFIGWAKFMEWKYPVEVVITSPTLFKGAGVIEAAATL